MDSQIYRRVKKKERKYPNDYIIIATRSNSNIPNLKLISLFTEYLDRIAYKFRLHADLIIMSSERSNLITPKKKITYFDLIILLYYKRKYLQFVLCIRAYKLKLINLTLINSYIFILKQN